ncbi:MAG: Permease of the drug/metabolite transporter (DMT) superfamily, partial [uncultured Rubrobacteraceae bacterium]
DEEGGGGRTRLPPRRALPAPRGLLFRDKLRRREVRRRRRSPAPFRGYALHPRRPPARRARAAPGAYEFRPQGRAAHARPRGRRRRRGAAVARYRRRYHHRGELSPDLLDSPDLGDAPRLRPGLRTSPPEGRGGARSGPARCRARGLGRPVLRRRDAPRGPSGPRGGDLLGLLHHALAPAPGSLSAVERRGLPDARGRARYLPGRRAPPRRGPAEPRDPRRERVGGRGLLAPLLRRFRVRRVAEGGAQGRRQPGARLPVPRHAHRGFCRHRAARRGLRARKDPRRGYTPRWRLPRPEQM